MKLNKPPNPPGLRLLEELGQGGSGQVYRAVRSATAEAVAVKFMVPPVTRERLERFEREFQQLQRWQHPHVVPVFEYNAHFERPYFVMELLAGQTLGQLGARAPRQQLAEPQLLSIFAQLAEVLAELHATGLTLQNLQPKHLLVVKNAEPWTVKLVDLREALPSGARRLIPLEMTPDIGPYLALEQFFGSKAVATADLYALGVMLYEMATGRKPYEIDTGDVQTLRQRWIQFHRQAPQPTTFAAWGLGLSADLEHLVQSLLFQNPNHRPTALKVRDELTRLMHTHTAPTRPAGPALLAAPVPVNLGVACRACRLVYPAGTFFCEDCGSRLAQVAGKTHANATQRRELRWSTSPPLWPALGRPQTVYGLLEIVPSPAQVRLPLNFILVLDRSQSMAGEPLTQLKAAVNTLIEHLTPKDVIAVVAFSDWVNTPIKAQFVLDKGQLKAEVAKLAAVGKTQFAPALREALKQAKRFYAPERLNRMVLLTDGRADDEAAAYQQAQQAHAQHVPIIGLGLGEQWREKFLVELSCLSLGQPTWLKAEEVYFIQSAAQTATIFQDVYHSLKVVAQQARLKLQLAPQVTLQRLWEVRPKLRAVRQSLPPGGVLDLPLGDLEEHGVAYLAEFVLPAEIAAEAPLLGEARLTYATPQPGANTQSLVLGYGLMETPSLAPHWPEKVFLALERVRAMSVQAQAFQALAQGETLTATAQMQSLASLFAAQGRADLAAQTGEVAQQIAQTGAITSGGRKTLRFTTQRTPRE